MTRKITRFLTRKYLNLEKNYFWEISMHKEIGVIKRLCRNAMENFTTKKPDDYIIATEKAIVLKHLLMKPVDK